MSVSSALICFLFILLHLMPINYLKNVKAEVELYELSLGHFFLTKKADFSVFLLIDTYPCGSVIVLFIRH